MRLELNKIRVMTKENEEILENSWLSKSDYEFELMCDINSDNPHITWDEFYEINDRHVEFEECLDKLNIKPYINSFSYN
jgi:hypothetical protein